MRLGWAAVGIVAMELLAGVVLYFFGSRHLAGLCWSTAIFVAVTWLVCDQYVRMRK